MSRLSGETFILPFPPDSWKIRVSRESSKFPGRVGSAKISQKIRVSKILYVLANLCKQEENPCKQLENPCKDKTNLI